MPRPISSSSTSERGVAQPQDVGGLAHLHHEGALPGAEAVGGADAGEEPVHHGRSRRAPAGTKEPLCASSTISADLPQVGALAAHVGAGQQQDLARGAVQRAVVGDERARAAAAARPPGGGRPRAGCGRSRPPPAGVQP